LLSNVIVVPFPRFDGVNVPSPQSVFITIYFSCPSAQSAKVRASAAVVIKRVVAVTMSTAQAPVRVCGVSELITSPSSVKFVQLIAQVLVTHVVSNPATLRF